MNFLAQKRSKTLLNEQYNPSRISRNPMKSDDFYYKEVANLTAAGGWSINFIDKSSFFDPEARRILNIPEGFTLSLRNSLQFYPPEYRKEITQAFFEGSNGKPFNGTVKMLTFDNKEFWARNTAKPIFNDENEVVGLQGIFQDITDIKQNELDLKDSLKVIESQNARLFNFANIISYNLRSHASNLQMTLELLSSSDSKDEEIELKNGLGVISESINSSIDHLNEIVTIQNKARGLKKDITFRDTLLTVQRSIQDLIFNSEAEIYSDFSEVPSINYIPDFLENIFINLLTNSIKFAHPKRNPVIDVCTYLDESNCKCLMIKDNGLGMDLEKFGDRIFNLYETYHIQKDSNGIGLFMTKNQIETMGGSISVSSIVNVGTTFTIKF